MISYYTPLGSLPSGQIAVVVFFLSFSHPPPLRYFPPGSRQVTSWNRWFQGEISLGRKTTENLKHYLTFLVATSPQGSDGCYISANIYVHTPSDGANLVELKRISAGPCNLSPFSTIIMTVIGSLAAEDENERMQ